LAGANQQLYPSIILSAHTNAAVNAATSGFYAFPIRTTSTESGLYPLSVNATNEIINNTGALTVGGNFNASSSTVSQLGNYYLNTPTLNSLTGSNAYTLTQSQILGGIVLIAGTTSGQVNVTFPSASTFISGAGFSVNQLIPIYVSIDNSSPSLQFDVQIIGNTGATYYGSSSGAFNFGRLLYCIINNVGSGTEAYSIYG